MVAYSSDSLDRLDPTEGQPADLTTHVRNMTERLREVGIALYIPFPSEAQLRESAGSLARSGCAMAARCSPKSSPKCASINLNSLDFEPPSHL
jgi:5-formyltetrahydrofolate cyclo-ligase